MNLDKVLKLFRALEREDVEYVLVGGVALNLHGLARATEDVDLFVKPSSDNIERLRRALHAVWRDPAIDDIQADDLAGPFPTIRYGPPDEDMVVDILASLGDAFRFEDLEARLVKWEGIGIHLATPRTLHRMKRDTVRPQDKADAVLLREKFNLEEE